MREERPRTEAELVEFLRTVDVEAPASLHRRVDALIERRAPARRRPTRFAAPPRQRLAAAAGLAFAALAVALTVALSGGSSSHLSVSRATALTLRPATQRAPSESHSHRMQLTASVDGVAFPYWEDALGWRSLGQRTDSVGGRTVTTVFYGDRSGRRVGYAIVAGTSPAPSSGGVVHWRGATPYRVISAHGVTAVAWLRSGHLCIVAGRGVSGAVLLHLASWRAPGEQAA